MISLAAIVYILTNISCLSLAFQFGYQQAVCFHLTVVQKSDNIKLQSWSGKTHNLARPKKKIIRENSLHIRDYILFLHDDQLSNYAKLKICIHYS